MRRAGNMVLAANKSRYKLDNDNNNNNIEDDDDDDDDNNIE